MNSNSNQNNSSLQSGKNRLAETKKKLSLHLKKILEQKKVQADEVHKQNSGKNKVYTSLHEVQCMKDVKSQNGFFHQYEMGKKLGEGCHSSVYKCIQKQDKKIFAVKMTKQKDLEIFQSIREGYRILKKLQHQNIIEARNLFINQKYMTCFMVIQYCDWQDLKSYLSRNNKIQKQQIAVILTQLLKTISYMHNSGVCHRDIKPDNILYNPTKGKIKIIDFDLARMKKFTNSQLEMMTKTGVTRYRAPQIFNSIYNEKVDIWSVGIIAYELLTSQYPFHSEYEEQQVNKICHEQPSLQGLSVWQQDLIQKLLCKDPQKRVTGSEALLSPFFFVNSKAIQSPPVTRTMMKSPSAGKQQFQKVFKNAFVNKFYDDDVANQFLGGSEGDIGVIRWVDNGQDQDQQQY